MDFYGSKECIPCPEGMTTNGKEGQTSCECPYGCSKCEIDDLLKHTKPYGVDGGLGIHYNNELVKKFIEVISNSKTIMDKYHEELEESKNAIKVLNCNIENKIEFQLPIEDSNRTLLKIKKETKTKKYNPT